MKKVLAWAVALALVLSSFTMAFAADTKTSKDFSDADQIHYTEAVDVMVATGIINGYPDGTFGPAKTVKRSEMAKMIAVMMNGGEDIGDQYKSACPFKDSQKHWAAGYIAYCSSEHIIDGRSADVFDPEAEVTGTEVAKMALTSLGYDSKIQGYTGENWAAAVLKDAKKNDLFDGLDKSFVPGNPCDRESAAQILFNCLKGTEVQYSSKMTVSAGDANVEVSGKATPVEENAKKEDGATPNMQLYEDVFNGKLVLTPKADGTPAVTDEYGNPGHTWTYDKEKVGTYTDTPAYEFVVEKIKDAKSDNAVNVLEAFKNYNENAAEKAVINPVVVNNNSTAKVGLGDSVKLYEVKAQAGDTTATDKTTYKAIVEHYEAYRIADVNTNVKAADAKNGVKAYVTFADLSGKFKDNELAGYDDSSYVKDAIIALALDKDNKIINSFAMKEMASGEATAIDAKTSAVTIDGSDYEKATAAKAFDGALEPGNEYTLYDYNGFYLASVKTAEAESDVHYGIVLASGKEAGTFSSTPVVKVFTSEGKEEVLELGKDAVTQLNALKTAEAPKGIAPKGDNNEYADGNGLDDFMFAYTLDKDGKIDSIDKYGKADAEFFAVTSTTDKPVKVKTNNVLNNKFVSDEVVVFWNKAEYTAPKEAEGDTPAVEEKQGSEYVIYGLDDLKDADAITGTYVLNKDKDTIVAMNLGASLEESTSILGFVYDSSVKNTKDGAVTTVNAYVDGKEETYTTAAGTNVDLPATEDVLVEFVLDGNELKEIIPVTPDSQAELQETFTAKAVKFNGGEFVLDKKSDALNMTSDKTKDNKNYQPVAKANVYIYDKTEKELTPSSYDAIRGTSTTIETTAVLYQTVKGSTDWNIVIFYEKELDDTTTGGNPS